MKNNLILLFVACILLCACQDVDEYGSLQLHLSLTEAALYNPNAKQLLLLMDGQDGSYESLQNSLGDNRALFEGVNIGSTYDFGPYYAIPYKNSNGVVMGAIIFPMDENVLDKEKRSLMGLLGKPIDLNESYLYGQIPVVRRGLYSSRFLDWENTGMNVSPNLVLFAKELNEHTVKLSEEECQVLPPCGTRSGDNGNTTVWLYYDIGRYSGISDGIVYGLSVESLIDIVQYEFDMMFNYCMVLDVQHTGYQTLQIQMDVTNTNYYERYAFDRILQEVIFNIRREVSRKNFSMTIQYSYVLASPTTAIGGGGTSGVTGSSTGNLHFNTGDTKQDVKEFVLDCNNVDNQYADSVSFLLDEIVSCRKEITTTISYEEYLDSVSKGTVEYSTCFSSYPEDGFNTISSVIRGEKYQVRNELNPSAVAEIHNHINGTPPSFRDILYTAKYAKNEDCRKFKATFVYNKEDGSYYILYIKNKEKAAAFYKKYQNELDEQTNSYKLGGKIDDLLTDYDIFMKNEKQLYAITVILNIFDSGISLHRIAANRDRTTYRASMEGSKKIKFKKCNY